MKKFITILLIVVAISFLIYIFSLLPKWTLLAMVGLASMSFGWYLYDS